MNKKTISLVLLSLLYSCSSSLIVPERVDEEYGAVYFPNEFKKDEPIKFTYIIHYPGQSGQMTKNQAKAYREKVFQYGIKRLFIMVGGMPRSQVTDKFTYCSISENSIFANLKDREVYDFNYVGNQGGYFFTRYDHGINEYECYVPTQYKSISGRSIVTRSLPLEGYIAPSGHIEVPSKLRRLIEKDKHKSFLNPDKENEDDIMTPILLNKEMQHFITHNLPLITPEYEKEILDTIFAYVDEYRLKETWDQRSKWLDYLPYELHLPLGHIVRNYKDILPSQFVLKESNLMDKDALSDIWHLLFLANTNLKITSSNKTKTVIEVTVQTDKIFKLKFENVSNFVE